MSTPVRRLSAARIVYLSYDGALDPLGRSQVVPIVEGLARAGLIIHLISFEKKERWLHGAEKAAMERRLAGAGIQWTALRYHRRFSVGATGWDLCRAMVVVAYLRIRRQCDVVHARSYPSAMVAWSARRVLGVPYVFDMRGLYADERVDAGIWPASSWRFRMTKWLERRFLRDAASVVTLTRASVPAICRIQAETGGGPEPEVIPTCVDLELFSPRDRPVGTPPTLAYFGSVGGWYLIDEMLRFGNAFLQAVEGSCLLWLVNDEIASRPGATQERVACRAREFGIDAGRFHIDSVHHEQLPTVLAPAVATYALIRATPSKTASATTKVSESLALGLPVAVNSGVGDSADVVKRERIGVVIDPYDAPSWGSAIMQLVELAGSDRVRTRCREVAESEHSLVKAVERYYSIYQSAIAGARNGKPR